MKKLDRRKFVTRSGMVFGGLLAPAPAILSGTGSLSGSNRSLKTPMASEPEESDLTPIPNFCSHEHWGSIESIGMTPERDGFLCDTVPGALPVKPVSIWDLLLDPYEGGWLTAGGKDPGESCRKAGYASMRQWWNESPVQALEAFRETVRSSLLTGAFQCTRKGILKLYGSDISEFKVEEWKRLDAEIQKNYSEMFSWYRNAMQKANFSELIRPVHPEFYFADASSASSRDELSFTHTILRIDPFLDFWKTDHPRRKALAEKTGIEPADAKSWRSFISSIFDTAARNNTTGIKQLQAYSRSLDFQPRSDGEVVFRGNLKPDEIACFQDWVVHECCRQAHEMNWAHQVHVGTNNIAHSGPLPLESLARLYPKMKVVMIHCWPFLKEAGYLAKLQPNMYIDTCWLPVLNPSFFREALASWLNYVPLHKIMLAHDSTSVEMATGSSLFTRGILSQLLTEQRNNLQVPLTDLRSFAADMLQNNAVHIYGIGREYQG